MSHYAAVKVQKLYISDKMCGIDCKHIFISVSSSERTGSGVFELDTAKPDVAVLACSAVKHS